MMSRKTVNPTGDCAETMFTTLHVVDNVTKNIIREIARECANKHVHVSEELITYLVRLLALDPARGISTDHYLSRKEVAAFVDEGVRRICDATSPSIITIKMQLYFNTTFKPRQELVRINREAYRARLDVIEKEIILGTPLSAEEMDRMYKKIVIYITLRSGLGNPLEFPVQKEAYVALYTIFPIGELFHFLDNLSAYERKDQLIELTHLVMGIRLFNRDCGRGGQGIEDLPNALKQAIETTHRTLSADLMKIMNHVYTLTAAVDYSYVISETEYFRPGEDRTTTQLKNKNLNLPPGITLEYLKYVKGLLIMSRQHEVYARQLMAELGQVRSNATTLIEKLRILLVKLHSVVKFRQAIPTAQVFPLFMEISETWIKLQDETIILADLNSMCWELNNFARNIDFDHPNIIKMTKSQEILTDARRMDLTGGLSISKFNNKCVVLDFRTLKQNVPLPLQYLGFCPFSLLEEDGALIPGNPSMGLCRWKDMYFVFSSVQAGQTFGKHPSRFVNGVLNLARHKPELIFCLQLYDQLVSLKHIGVLVVRRPPLIIQHNARVQTEMHPIKKNIQKNYKWNVWDLKRNALQKCNIVGSKSQYPQTLKSHFRAGVATQTYPPKGHGMQTMQDDYTNVPTIQNYIFGLRGRRDDQQEVVELERPIQE